MVGESSSVPPQLRMFMRTTLNPAANARAVLPSTYCELDEPSSPWMMTTVRRSLRTSAGCQWQWQRTELGPYPPTGPSTSTTRGSGSGRGNLRGRKFPASVCRWPLRSILRGVKSLSREVDVLSGTDSILAVMRCAIPRRPLRLEARLPLLHHGNSGRDQLASLAVPVFCALQQSEALIDFRLIPDLAPQLRGGSSDTLMGWLEICADIHFSGCHLHFPDPGLKPFLSDRYLMLSWPEFKSRRCAADEIAIDSSICRE